MALSDLSLPVDGWMIWSAVVAPSLEIAVVLGEDIVAPICPDEEGEVSDDEEVAVPTEDVAEVVVDVAPIRDPDNT